MTFPTEVRRIWGRKFSGATLVYLVIRYTAVIERVFLVLQVLLWTSSDEVRQASLPSPGFPLTAPQVCSRIMYTIHLLTILNHLAFSGMPTNSFVQTYACSLTRRCLSLACLRVYGVWGCDWKPLIVVAPLALVRPILSTVSERNRYPLSYDQVWDRYSTHSMGLSKADHLTAASTSTICLMRLWKCENYKYAVRSV